MKINLSASVGIPLSDPRPMAFTAKNIIALYEDQAKAILKRDGYPGTLTGLFRKKEKYLPDLANGKGVSQVYSIFWMLWGFEDLRRAIARNDADGAACSMAYALHWAAKVQLNPLERFFSAGVGSVNGGAIGGKKSGVVRADKAERDRQVDQKEAEKIWQKRHKWGVKPVAERVARITGHPYETVRKRIEKPLV